MVAWEEIEKTPDPAVQMALAYLEAGRVPPEPRKRVQEPENVTVGQFIASAAVIVVAALAMIGAGGLCWKALSWLWDVL